MPLKTKADILEQRPRDPEGYARAKRALEFTLALHELRERRGLTQAYVAERLATSRPNVGRIEQEDDIRLSTLERYVEALGGRLRISVVFDDDEVTLAP